MPLILVAPLFIIALWLAVYGMQRGNDAWLVPLVSRMLHPNGSIFKKAALWAAGKLLQGVSALIRTVTHYMSVAVAHASGPVVHYFWSIARWFEGIGAEAERFAGDVAWGFERLVHHTIPRAAHAAAAAATHPIHIGLSHARRDLAILERYARGIDRLLRRDALPKIRHLTHEVDVVIPREIAHARAVERALARDLARVKGQLAQLKGLLGVGAMTALIVGVLTKAFPHLFCRNVTKGLQRLCGLPSSLFDDLLGAFADLYLLEHICDVITLMEDGLALIDGPLQDFIGGAADMFIQCGYDLPAGLPTNPPLDVPTTSGNALVLN